MTMSKYGVATVIYPLSFHPNNGSGILLQTSFSFIQMSGSSQQQHSKCRKEPLQEKAELELCLNDTSSKVRQSSVTF